MRTIKLGGKEVKIKGSPMTPFFYKSEFKQSLSGDLMSMKEMDANLAAFDDVNMIQMIWALEKTAVGNIKPFKKWLEEIEYINLQDCIDDVIEEAAAATFREAEKVKPKDK